MKRLNHIALNTSFKKLIGKFLDIANGEQRGESNASIKTTGRLNFFYCLKAECVSGAFRLKDAPNLFGISSNGHVYAYFIEFF